MPSPETRLHNDRLNRHRQTLRHPPNNRGSTMTKRNESVLPFRISVLVFLQNPDGKELLLLRTKSPNRGHWSPVGGKLKMETGESPCQCAIRETGEEIGLELTPDDLHLFAVVSETAYEGTGHWLMFLYRCRAPVPALPDAIDEGRFAFFTRREIDGLKIPETDRTALWPLYDRHRDHFVALRADCTPGGNLDIVIEETFGADSHGSDTVPRSKERRTPADND